MRRATSASRSRAGRPATAAARRLVVCGVCALAGCAETGPEGALADAPALLAAAESAPSPAAPLSDTGAPRPPMPGPRRGRLGAAVKLNTDCVTCHAREAEEWRGSLHRRSDVDAAYRSAFAIEPMPFCRACHAPESDPAREPPQPVSELGVGCVTCHVTEEGVVLAAGQETGAERAPHPVRRSADFAGSGACAGCHEFRFPGAPAGATADGSFMQTTAREHARSPAAERSCASCHMPEVDGHRSHSFSEVRDPAWLRARLTAEAVLTEEETVRITLAQTDPAHAFPTGDLFRRLLVGCEVRGPRGEVVRRDVRALARHFEVVPGMPDRRLRSDDRVQDRPTVIELDAAPPPSAPRPASVRWWVTYQRVATAGAGRHPEEAQIESEVPLHAGLFAWETSP